MHLAYIKGSNGEFLVKNSVISYYRQVKKWLLGFFASQKPLVEDRLLEMARTLERDCMTRVKGGIVKKAASCTKGDLLLLTNYLYMTATSSTDYQDAALVCSCGMSSAGLLTYRWSSSKVYPLAPTMYSCSCAVLLLKCTSVYKI